MSIDRRELENLVSRMEAHGAACIVTHGREGYIEEIQISGAKGIGPHPMSPLSAAERMREWLWQRT